MDGFVLLGLLAVPLLISLSAFLLEFIATYGLQDSGFAKYRRLFRAVGLFTAGAWALAITLVALGLAALPA